MPATNRELEIKLKAARREAKIHRRCEGETTKRLESDLNHISAALATCLSKDEYGARHAPLEDRIAALTSRIDKIEARGLGRGDSWTWLGASIGVIVGIVTAGATAALLFKH